MIERKELELTTEEARTLREPVESACLRTVEHRGLCQVERFTEIDVIGVVGTLPRSGQRITRHVTRGATVCFIRWFKPLTEDSICMTCDNHVTVYGGEILCWDGGNAKVQQGRHLVRGTPTELGEYALFLYDAIHS